VVAHPLILVVIVAGVLVDQPIRQVLVVSSEIYRQIAIPERLFGFIAAGSAAVGLLTATPLRRLALRSSPRRNAAILAVATFAGLCGVAAFVPWWGIVFVMVLSTALRMVVFLQSHYLNQLVSSDRRATVLSFRGLAVNVAYGLMSLGFAAAVAAVEHATAGDGGAAGSRAGATDAFRVVVGWLPWSFAGACLLFAVWTLRRLGTTAALGGAGGFAQPQGRSAPT
jgi:hypothetical protein